MSALRASVDQPRGWQASTVPELQEHCLGQAAQERSQVISFLADMWPYLAISAVAGFILFILPLLVEKIGRHDDDEY